MKQLKVDVADKRKHIDDALSTGVTLLDYADTINHKIGCNKKYIEQKEMRKPDFVRPKKVHIILREVNTTLAHGNRPISKTTLLRYYKIGLDKGRAIGAPPTIPMNLLNFMHLHTNIK